MPISPACLSKEQPGSLPRIQRPEAAQFRPIPNAQHPSSRARRLSRRAKKQILRNEPGTESKPLKKQPGAVRPYLTSNIQHPTSAYEHYPA